MQAAVDAPAVLDFAPGQPSSMQVSRVTRGSHVNPRIMRRPSSWLAADVEESCCQLHDVYRSIIFTSSSYV